MTGEAMSDKPILLWLRRDLRLSDHAALSAAAATGRPVIPVFIRDAQVDALGAAPKWRLGLSLEDFAARLAQKGQRLTLRSGDALEVLQSLIEETGADTVYWSRIYDKPGIDRDTAVKSALKGQGVTAQSFPGFVLFEPWTVSTKDGGFYKVYSPFWRAVKDIDLPAPLSAPKAIRPPEAWPASEALGDWRMGAAMRRGAAVVRPHLAVGEEAAQGRLGAFIAHKADAYKARRDFPGEEATSRLSENLTYGEISPATIWHAGLRAMQEGAKGAEHFLKELVWRDFAWHLMFHTPHIATDNWREGWDGFPWRDDPDAPDLLAWKQGRTGVAFVDAAMRELYVTGTMHNRSRMIAASYLTKHLLIHWRHGLDWFANTLVDWDPASNAMGWQWVAGSGPDAAPYFRIFNPDTQAEKFDEDGAYRRAFLAEGRAHPSPTALSFFDAVPRAWGLSPDMAPARPTLDLKAGRERALAAYEALKG